jgi:hypothetical protein
MAHGDAREEKWRGNKRMEWVTNKRHMTAEHRLARTVQTLQADVHSSPASSRLNWRPYRLKWTRPFRRTTESGFCSCAITFQTQSTTFCECIFIPSTQCACTMLSSVAWPAVQYFPHYLKNGTIFEKKNVLYKKCGLILSKTSLWNIPRSMKN